MTIESGSTSNGTRPVTSDPRHAKGKTAAGGDPGLGVGGTFGALLASLDPTLGTLPVDPQGVAGDVGGAGLVSTVSQLGGAGGKDAMALDPHALTRRGKVGDVSGLTELGVVGDANPELAMLAAGSLDEVSSAGLPVAKPADTQPDAPLDASALLLQSAQWSAVPAASSTLSVQTPPAGAAQSVLTSGVKSAHVPVKPEGGIPVPASSGEVAAEPSAALGKVQRDAAAKHVAASAAVAVAVEKVVAAENRLVQAQPHLTEQALAPVVAALSIANTGVPARREEQARERSVFRSNATEGSALGQSMVSSQAPSPVQYTADAQMAPDVYVAEKVAYWISNDVQNAELKLEGIGSEAVEVSIRMHGNEAHVAFRTDEMQARAALENASSHLKDMLQREGLVLSGVSVGTAGAGDSGDSDRRSRQGARQSMVVSVAPVRAERGTVVGRSAGGTLDLFV